MATATANPLDMLRAMATKPKAASRSKTPEATIPELADTIKGWHAAKAERDRWESVMQTHQSQITEAAREARYEACRRDHTVHSSVRLNGAVTVTFTSRYSKVPEDRAADLQATFGTDYPRYFADQLAVSLTESAVEDQDFLSELIACVTERFGAEEFGRRFKVARSLTPTKAFHEAIALCPDVRAKAEPFMGDETIRPYSPSCKP